MRDSSRSNGFFFSPESFSLDIGCGEVARGTINIDLYLPTKMPKNFILASSEHLPFQSNVIDVVSSSYVIEHCLNPSHFIQDQVRCSRDKVIIITDNSEWIGDYYFRLTGNGRIFHDEHYYRWTVEYLENLIRRLGYGGKVEACNLSPTYVVALLSKLGRIPRIGRVFYRDIKAEISKKRT
jgi:ubiquinone/menaquinone biosynthesis C-methylase UbiE